MPMPADNPLHLADLFDLLFTGSASDREALGGRTACGVIQIISYSRVWWGVWVFLALATGRGSVLAQGSTMPAVPFTAPVFVTNESFIIRRFELRVNDVVVIDTVVGTPQNATSAVLFDSVRVAPGHHRLLLVDHYRKQQFRFRVTARPGPLFILNRPGIPEGSIS